MTLHYDKSRDHLARNLTTATKGLEVIRETIALEAEETAAERTPTRLADGFARRAARAEVERRCNDLIAFVRGLASDQPRAQPMPDPQSLAGTVAAILAAVGGGWMAVSKWGGKVAPAKEETITDQGTLLLIDRLERCKAMRTQAISLGKEEATETMEMLAVESVRDWMGANDAGATDET